ncbi:hypothetical protein Tco_0008704 [Tanacetum coccineum]
MFPLATRVVSRWGIRKGLILRGLIFEGILVRSFDHNTTSVENVGSPGASSSAGHASNDGVIVDDGSGTRSSTSTVQPGISGLRSSSRIIDGQSVLYTQATGTVVATLTAS